MSRKWWLKKIDANLHPDEARDMKIKYPTAHYYEETLESLEQRAEEMEVGGYRYAWKKYMYSGRTHVVVTSAIPSRIRSRGKFDQSTRGVACSPTPASLARTPRAAACSARTECRSPRRAALPAVQWLAAVRPRAVPSLRPPQAGA